MIDALLLLQDVQLLCFTVIFFFVSRQYPRDRARRWLFYSFLANAAGALMDFSAKHLPLWVSRGVNMEAVPLSYALLTVAFVYFLRRGRWTIWASFAVMLVSLPVQLLWSGHTDVVPGDTLVDAVLAVQTLLLAIILPRTPEKATRSPRWLMASFFYVFAAIEFARTYVVVFLHTDPDLSDLGTLSLVSSAAYVVSTSVLPLAFIWMMNSRLEADLLQQNMLDPLTHVLNRRGLRRALERELELQTEQNKPLTIAMMDFDHFKELNDTYGHAAGDIVLVAIARMLRQALRENDSIARSGGEEFVIVLPETDKSTAGPILERLRQEIERFAVPFEGETLHVTASFGATERLPGSAKSGNELLKEADVALYQAKKDRRNCVRFFGA